MGLSVFHHHSTLHFQNRMNGNKVVLAVDQNILEYIIKLNKYVSIK